MAADLALGAADTASGFALRKAQEVADDPVGALISISRKVGVGMVVAGVVMGAAGWYLKAASTTAMNNEVNVIGNIGAIFSNIKAPQFQPAPTGTAPVLGSNPLSDVQNFAGDAWNDIQAAGSDVAQIGAAMGTLGEDIAVGLIDFAKSVLAFVQHFPDILWNGMVWGVGGALADILNWVFPYFIVFGSLLLVISTVASVVRWGWRTAVADGFNAAKAKAQVRLAARGERFWDRVFGNFKTQETVPVAPVPEVPVSTSSEPGPAFVGQTNTAGDSQGATETRPDTPGEVPMPPAPDSPPDIDAGAAAEPQKSEAGEGGEAVPTVSQPEPAPPAPPQTNGTTEQTEALLGGVPPNSGWTDKDVQEYLQKAPEPPEPEPLSGKDVAARADELFA